MIASVSNMVMRSLAISALECTCSHCGKCHQHIQCHRCERCEYAWYCSVACQTAASSEHIQQCEPPPAWFKRVQLPPPSWFERMELSDAEMKVDEDDYVKAMAIAQSDSWQVPAHRSARCLNFFHQMLTNGMVDRRLTYLWSYRTSQSRTHYTRAK
jgi:hypothetical protein